MEYIWKLLFIFVNIYLILYTGKHWMIAAQNSLKNFLFQDCQCQMQLPLWKKNLFDAVFQKIKSQNVRANLFVDSLTEVELWFDGIQIDYLHDKL